NRRLKDAKANPQADANENDRESERNSPAPSGELIARPCAETKDRKVCEKQAAWDAKLWPRRHQPALPVMTRPFHRQQYRAAPFTTDANALNHAQDRQDDCAQMPIDSYAGTKAMRKVAM